MIRFLGWFNFVMLILVTTLPLMLYWQKKLNKKSRIAKLVLKMLKPMRKAHHLWGLLLFLGGLYHGYLALGDLRIVHTGTLLWLSVLLLLLTAIASKILKPPLKILFFKLHRRLVLVPWVIFLWHFFNTHAIYYPLF